MCTIIQPNDITCKLKCDLTVYKLTAYKAENTVSSFFYNREVLITIGKQFSTSMSRSFPMPVAECHAFSYDEKANYIKKTGNDMAVEVREGFHSFKCFADCLREAVTLSSNFSKPVAVCECIIPQGSEVIDGYFNNIVSNRIYYTRIIHVYNN